MPPNFESIYTKYSPKIYKYAYRYFKNKEDAENIVQETFVALLTKWEHLQHHPNLAGWLYTATGYCIKTYYKQLGPIPNLALGELVELPNEAYEEMESDIEVDSILRLLSDDERHVATLYYKMGVHTSDVSQHLGVSEAVVRKRLQRAREHLRKKLKI